MELKNIVSMRPKLNIIGREDNQWTLILQIDLKLNNNILIFKVIFRLCIQKITLTGLKLKESILIDQWNSKKKAIPLLLPIKDLLTICGIQESLQD